LAFNRLANQLGKNRNLAKLISRGWYQRLLVRWEGEKRNKKYRRIPDASFQEVEEHKHNFIYLTIADVT
jgi:hypothetical protein